MDDLDDPRRAEAVITDLASMRGATCTACGRVVCGHEALLSRSLGFLGTPRCLTCLARALGREPEALRNELYAYLSHQACLRQGWEWANREESHGAEELPSCLWPSPAARSAAPAAQPALAASAPPAPDSAWDAGGMGCGELVLELRLRMAALGPGRVLALTAHDPGAPEDLPAWCRMTGHTLVAMSHPRYWIRHKQQAAASNPERIPEERLP